MSQPLQGLALQLHGVAWLGRALPVSPRELGPDPQIPTANHLISQPHVPRFLVSSSQCRLGAGEVSAGSLR